jgi:hypothetical protein
VRPRTRGAKRLNIHLCHRPTRSYPICHRTDSLDNPHDFVDLGPSRWDQSPRHVGLGFRDMHISAGEVSIAEISRTGDSVTTGTPYQVGDDDEALFLSHQYFYS